MRLARNTSPLANGRPFIHTQNASATTTADATAAVHQSQSCSPVTNADVKLFQPSTFNAQILKECSQPVSRTVRAERREPQRRIRCRIVLRVRPGTRVSS